MRNCFRRRMITLLLSISAADAMAEPPKAVVESICRPTFEMKDQSLSAGTAFLMETGVEKQPVVLVTAHHLLGPMGGLPTEVAWNDVPKSVKRATCMSIVTPAQSWTASPLAIPGAASFNKQTKDGLRDIALLTVQGKPTAKPLKLAPMQPKLGDTVWLVPQLVSGAPKEKLLFKAKPVRVQTCRSTTWSTIPKALLNCEPSAERLWSTSAAKWSPSTLRAHAWRNASTTRASRVRGAQGA